MSISTVQVGLICFPWIMLAEEFRVKQVFLVVLVRVGGQLVPVAAQCTKNPTQSEVQSPVLLALGMGYSCCRN